jgi:hypothetical protein
LLTEHKNKNCDTIASVVPGTNQHCQVTVNCHDAERTLAWPVVTRLSLPREWAFDPARWAKAHLPRDMGIQAVRGPRR